MKDQLELKEGEYYFIDRGFGNGGIVKLIKLGHHFSTVLDPDTDVSWMTMTRRLSKLTEQEKATL